MIIYRNIKVEHNSLHSEENLKHSKEVAMFKRFNQHFYNASHCDSPCSIEQGAYEISNGCIINGEPHWRLTRTSSNMEEVRYVPAEAVRRCLPVCDNLGDFWEYWHNGYIISVLRALEIY